MITIAASEEEDLLRLIFFGIQNIVAAYRNVAGKDLMNFSLITQKRKTRVFENGELEKLPLAVDDSRVFSTRRRRLWSLEYSPLDVDGELEQWRLAEQLAAAV